jgi:hypothetical protein
MTRDSSPRKRGKTVQKNLHGKDREGHDLGRAVKPGRSTPALAAEVSFFNYALRFSTK